MADDVVDLLQFLNTKKQSAASTNAAPPAPMSSPLTPLTQQALSKTDQFAQNRPASAIVASGNLSWFDRNQRKDELGRVIPIDTEQGLDLGEYSRMVWQRRPEERMAVLRKLFPNQSVRTADTGEPIIEVLGEGGNRFDILVNPPGFNARDLLEVGAAAPELGGSAIGTGLGAAGGAAVGSIGGPIGAAIGGLVGAATGGATGAAVGGAAKDVVARSAEGLPINAGEIKEARSDEAVLNAAFDLGLGTGAKALRVLSPFATTPGKLQFNAEKARQYFVKNWGVTEKDLPMTPAERSGSKMLSKVEAFEGGQPGASTIVGRIQSRGEETINKIFNAAVGGRIPEEDLSRDLVRNLKRDIARPVEEAVTQARQDLVNTGESELVNVIDAFTGTARVGRKEAGDAARAEFKVKLENAETKVNDAYAKVRALPGGSGKMLPVKPLEDAANSILAELPTSLGAQSKKSFDAYGNPIEKKVVTKEILQSGRPEGLVTFLNDMKKISTQKMSISELTTLKNAARDEIAKTEAVPQVKDRWFTLVSVAYDNALKQGSEDVGKSQGNTALRDALLEAREVYKKEKLPFDREGLHDLLRTEYEAGFQAPEQIVSRLFSGGRAEHNYRVLQETLGANSPAFRKVKRSLLDGWMLDASDPLTKRISPDKLEASLMGFRTAHPEIYKDIIGSQEQSLFQITRSIKAAGKEISDIDPDEFAQLIRAKSATRNNVIRLMIAQKVRDSAFANQVINGLKSGGDFEESPVKFVRALHNSDIHSDQIKSVLGTLKPDQVEALRTAELYRILDKAGEFKSDYAPMFVEGVQGPVSPKGLMKALGSAGSAERARTELLLGPNYEELVKNAISLQAPREIKNTVFKGAGSIAGNTMIAQLAKHPLKYATSFATKMFTAVFYTSRIGEGILLNKAFTPKETTALANSLIASQPFIERVVDVVGDEDAAYSIVNDLKRSIDKTLMLDARPTEGEAQQAELMEFLRTRKGKVKVETVP